MLHVFPDYYTEFRCINSRCRHNCCIGWEIDIDPETAEFYRNVGGDFGKRLAVNISSEEEPHFILGENERCPFLNRNNLCDIITTLGEDRLCTICAEHPRFHNELPGRIESGLGLCCEETARLILTRREPVQLIAEGEPDCDDEIIALRDELIGIVQNRQYTVSERINQLLSRCGTLFPEGTIGEWAEFLLSLEQLDEEWTQLVTQLSEEHKSSDRDGFSRHMAERCTEYEQLLVYMLYRHTANAPDADYIGSRVNFAVFACWIIYELGAMIWSRTGEFSTGQQIELARMFSSEIEYSDENLYILLDELDF